MEMTPRRHSRANSMDAFAQSPVKPWPATVQFGEPAPPLLHERRLPPHCDAGPKGAQQICPACPLSACLYARPLLVLCCKGGQALSALIWSFCTLPYWCGSCGMG